jgi:hypothetical protein
MLDNVDKQPAREMEGRVAAAMTANFISFTSDKGVRVGEQGLSTLIGREDEVAIDDHPHRKARADGDGRLDVEVALCDLLTCLTEAVAAALAKRRRDGAVVGVGAKLGADADHR